MFERLLSATLLWLASAVCLTAAEESSPLVLWYAQPAKQWVEALPVGNGRLGAMVFGGAESERLQFNESTLWTGRPREYQHEGAAAHLPAIRKLLAEGKQKEAEKLASEHFMSVPLRQYQYQPLGDLRLKFPGHDEPAEYRRQLDLDAAVATVRYQIDGTTFTRETLASFPDQVIVTRVAADKPGQVHFTATLDSPQPDTKTAAVGKNQLVLRGELKPGKHPSGKEDNCLKFEARLLVAADGGEVRATADGLEIRGANAATLIVTAATSFKNFRDVSADPAARCASVLKAVEGKTFDALRTAHLADHRRLFRRVSLDLGTTAAARLPTDQRLKQFFKQSEADPQLAALYFQFGRYLLIASSRPGGQPANLQGIWNDSLRPPWDSKWTVNINTEMNYWPAETCNLAECHEPLFDMLDDLVDHRRQDGPGPLRLPAAGCCTTTPTCGAARPRSTPRTTASGPPAARGSASTSGSITCSPATRSSSPQRAYPVMKEAAEFFVDFLVEGPEDRLADQHAVELARAGRTGRRAHDGPPDHPRPVRQLHRRRRGAGRRRRVRARSWPTLRKRIAPNQIGRHGQLQEWLEDKDDPKNQHRHVSHLWGLHPGREITPRGTPELAAAARQVARIPRRRRHRLEQGLEDQLLGAAARRRPRPQDARRG